MSGSRHELDNSYFIQSEVFGDALLTSLEGTKNHFFDAMSGGFKYDVTNDFVDLQTNEMTLNFSQFASRKHLPKISKDLQNVNTSYTGSLFNNKANKNELEMLITLAAPIAPVQDFQSSVQSQTKNLLNDANEGLGVSIVQRNRKTTHSFGMSLPTEEFDGEHNIIYGDAFEMAYSVDTRLSDKIGVSSIFGMAREQDTFLGSSGSGAYDLSGSEALTNYFGLKAQMRIDEGLAINATSLLSNTEQNLNDSNSLMSFDSVRTSSFELKAEKNNKALDDYLSVSLSQPTRIENGEAILNVVDTYDHLGNLHFKQKRHNISPSARQLNMSIEYSKKIYDDKMINFAGIYSKYPGHDKDAKSEAEVFVGMSDSNINFGVQYNNKTKQPRVELGYQFKF